MKNYPLEWGTHTDPKNTTDVSGTPDTFPAPGRYPLEFGNHIPPTPLAPVFIPQTSTLDSTVNNRG